MAVQLLASGFQSSNCAVRTDPDVTRVSTIRTLMCRIKGMYNVTKSFRHCSYWPRLHTWRRISGLTIFWKEMEAKASRYASGWRHFHSCTIREKSPHQQFVSARNCNLYIKTIVLRWVTSNRAAINRRSRKSLPTSLRMSAALAKMSRYGFMSELGDWVGG